VVEVGKDGSIKIEHDSSRPVSDGGGVRVDDWTVHFAGGGAFYRLDVPDARPISGLLERRVSLGRPFRLVRTV
jgi:hypothetical protein